MIRNIFFFYLIICFALSIEAQQFITIDKASAATKEKFADGKDLTFSAYDEASTRKGIAILKELATKKPILLDACISLGDYYEGRNFQNAIFYYRKSASLSAGYNREILFTLAELEYRDRQYDSSLAHTNVYLAFPKTDYHKKAERHKARLEFIIHSLKNPLPYNPTNIGPPVNTSDHEYDAVTIVHGNNTELVLTTDVFLKRDSIKFRKVGRKNEDIVSYKLSNGQWTQKRIWSEINTLNNEGCVSVSADGKWMAFVRCNFKEDQGDCDVFYSSWEDGKWSSPMSFGPLINTTAWESQPVFSADGNTVYFVRDVFTKDILQSQKNPDGTWSKPIELNICTGDNEHGPYLHPGGTTLYFISDRPIGMGGDDIFVSHLQADGNWSEPKNIGYPINTERDELFVSVSQDGKHAYLSSDRAQGQGGMDVYVFETDPSIRPAVTHLEGIVREAASGKGIQASVYIREEGKKIYAGTSTDADGKYSFILPAGKKHEVHAEARGFFVSEEHLITKKDSVQYASYAHNFEMQAIKNGDAVVLKNVHFVQSQDILLESSFAELERLENWLQNNPDIRIKICGHTDNVGNPKANQELSELRAKKVKSWLIDRGIDSKRLSNKGFGSISPIAPNDSEENRKKNRRVEFLIEK